MITSVQTKFQISFCCKVIGLFFLLSYKTILLQAQSDKFLDPREAKEHYSHKNYIAALRVYKELLKKDAQNVDYRYKIALCYLNTNINKSLAIPYLEFITKKSDAENEAWFDLGRAYHYAGRFDDAIKAYTKYKQSAGSKDQEKAERRIEMCYNGKELMKFPLDVKFENLGKEINSENPDYYPFITSNESFMVFTSRREENIGGEKEIDGYYSSDIYISSTKNGVWTKPRNVGEGISTRYDEQAVDLSSDGRYLMIYLDHIDSLGNIYLSEYRKTTFEEPEKLNHNVNQGFESSGSIAKEGNLIFFASERSGGLGETDIYMAKKLPNGQWAVPQNLGPNINTKYKEDFPHLSDDGKTLYFASQGHSSMGDFDIFKAIWDEETNTWSPPKNIGYPINTTGDDRNISFTADGRTAYLSSLREGGLGDLDIYKVTFNSSPDQQGQGYTIVSGHVLTGDTINKKIEATITAMNITTNEEFTYIPTVSSGKYVMALSPGKYTISIESTGYKFLVDNIVILDKGSFQPEISKDFLLVKSK